MLVVQLHRQPQLPRSPAPHHHPPPRTQEARRQDDPHRSPPPRVSRQPRPCQPPKVQGQPRVHLVSQARPHPSLVTRRPPSHRPGQPPTPSTAPRYSKPNSTCRVVSSMPRTRITRLRTASLSRFRAISRNPSLTRRRPSATLTSSRRSKAFPARMTPRRLQHSNTCSFARSCLGSCVPLSPCSMASHALTPLRLLSQPEDVNAIVAGKLAQRYAGPDVEAMKAVANAHSDRSLDDFETLLQEHKKGALPPFPPPPSRSPPLISFGSFGRALGRPHHSQPPRGAVRHAPRAEPRPHHRALQPR